MRYAGHKLLDRQAICVVDRLVNDLETERHIGAGITIGYRKYVDPVDIFPALKKVPYTRGQATNHSG